MLLKIFISIFFFFISQIVAMDESQIVLLKKCQEQKIFKCISYRQPENMKQLLTLNPNLANAVHTDGIHILSYTVECGSLKDVKLLLKYKANVNTTQDRYKANCTPLHYAVKSYTKTNLLLEHKANPNVKSFYGDTPLHFCLHDDAKLETIKLLLDCGANINAQNDRGISCLHKAAINNTKRMKILLAYNPNINALNNEGQNALHIAVASIQIKIVELLLQDGADAQQKDNYDKTPLDIAWNLPTSYPSKDEMIQLLERC